MARPANRHRSRVARFTRRGRFLAIVGGALEVVAYSVHRAELVPLATFLVVLPVAARFYVRFRPARYRASREFSAGIIAAKTRSGVMLDVANLSSYRSPVANWRDTWPWRPFVTTPQPLGQLAAAVAGKRTMGSTARLSYEVTPSRRGLFDVGPLIVDFTDPFGLADGAVTAHGTARLVVTPAIVELPEGAVAIAADEGPTRMRQRRAFGGEDDLMTREYRQGDAMRRVHWRASAHHGELMVRQEEQRSHAEARILIDTLRTSYRDARGVGTIDEAESESFEWAVSFSASLALYLVDRGFVVRVIETGSQQLAPVEELDAFLESLAAVQLVSAAPDRMSLLHAVARPDRSQGSVFAVVSNPDARTVDRLRAQRSSFDLAVVFIVDPWASPHFEPLRAAGWICVAVHPNDSIESAWLTAGAEQEQAQSRST